jgi:hypothetical protein
LKGRKQWYLAAWPKEDITKAVELAESISSIRNKKVYFDGDESLWNDIFRAN